MELNASQHAAITTTEGPLLIVAGPGSGKTMTLVGRIIYLIQEKKVNPDHILAISFTQKAAQEIRKRVKGLLDKEKQSLPHISTFHALALKILKTHAPLWAYPDGPRPWRLISASEQKSIVTHLLKENGDASLTVKQFLLKLSQWKGTLFFTPSKESSLSRSGIIGDSSLTPLFQVYQKRLQQSGFLDFDDLILYTLDLFTQSPEIERHYQTQFQYLLLDEAQDANPIQFHWIERLAHHHKNITVIGDPDQAIYGFRGASSDPFLAFHEKYPEATLLHLDQNYRSTQSVVKATQSLIQNNQKRIPHKPWTSNGTGAPLHLTTFDTAWQESSGILSRIEQLLGGSVHHQLETSHAKNGTSDALYHFNEIAVLYRWNETGRFLEQAFEKAGLPYQRIGEKGFFEHREIQDMIAFLRLLEGAEAPNEKELELELEAWGRILKHFVPGVGEKTIERFKAMKKVGESILAPGEASAPAAREQHSEACPRIESQEQTPQAELSRFLDRWERTQILSRDKSLAQQIRTIIEKMELKTHYDDTTPEGTRRYDHLLELINIAHSYEETNLQGLTPPLVATANDARRRFLEDTLLSRSENHWNPDREAITLTTVHAAKGLEFPVVFVVGLEETLFPSLENEADLAGLEEERRLFYVALTRAKERLYLSHAQERLIQGERLARTPSRFLKELPAELMEYQFVKEPVRRRNVLKNSPQLQLF